MKMVRQWRMDSRFRGNDNMQTITYASVTDNMTSVA